LPEYPCAPGETRSDMQALRYTRCMYEYPYPRPALTSDVVALRACAGGREVLLIRRRWEPFAGLWALPGGFVEEWELPEDAARREFAEETGIAWQGELSLVGVFAKRGRDPRGWTVTTAYLARLDGCEYTLAPADDADDARWFPAAELPPMAFDHDTVVEAALGML